MQRRGIGEAEAKTKSSLTSKPSAREDTDARVNEYERRVAQAQRAHDFLEKKSLSTCPQCHEAKMPHRVCPKCGYYKGREVIAGKDIL